MSNFSYSTGNPSNLVAGNNASMADIQGPFTDLRTFINGSLDETNVPNLTAAFTTWKNLPFRAGAQISGGTGAATYAMFQGPSFAGNASAVGASPVHTMFYIDSTDFNANARTTKMRLRFNAVTNVVAPGITMTAGLYQVTGVAGASNSPPAISTLSAVISGSTVAIATPSGNTANVATGSEFNFPSSGFHVLAFTTSGTLAANANVDLVAYLQMRQV